MGRTMILLHSKAETGRIAAVRQTSEIIKSGILRTSSNDEYIQRPELRAGGLQEGRGCGMDGGTL